MSAFKWRKSAIGLPVALAVAFCTAGTASAAAAASATGTSDSWAGYQATAAASVSATWVEPSVTCTSPNTAVTQSVNFGGTLMASVSASCNEFDGLSYMMWGPGGETPDVTVNAGDSITATATYEGQSGEFYEYSVTMTDHTQNWTYNSGNGGYSPGLGDTVQVGIEAGLTECSPYVIDVCFAQWQPESLPAFSTTNFTGVTVNGGPIGSAANEQVNLVSGSTTEAATSSLDSTGEDFSITYGG